jgi:hypothetical protein
VYNGELVAGGEFAGAGGNAASNIARWNGTSWQPLGTGINSRVYALTVFNGELFAGGWISSAGSVSVKDIARWDGMTWRSLGTGMHGGDSLGSLQGVYALASYRGNVIVGGDFTSAGGNNSAFWARWGTNCPRGDMNCDQTVDLNDLTPFVTTLLYPESYGVCEHFTADLNADGLNDGQDINLFATCLLGGGCP